MLDSKNGMRQKLKLPEIRSYKLRLILGVTLATVSTFGYVFASHRGVLNGVNLLLTKVDHLIPFIPETVWIYATQHFVLAILFLITRDAIVGSRFFYSLLICQILAIFCFIVFPVIYPRGNFEQMMFFEKESLTRQLALFLYEMDKASNCFPSLHVSTCVLMGYVVSEWKVGFVFKILPYLLFLGIAVSTLTFKQHFFVDVIAGALMAIGVQYFVNKNVENSGHFDTL